MDRKGFHPSEPYYDLFQDAIEDAKSILKDLEETDSVNYTSFDSSCDLSFWQLRIIYKMKTILKACNIDPVDLTGDRPSWETEEGGI